jgi:hypothetical protein
MIRCATLRNVTKHAPVSGITVSFFAYVVLNHMLGSRKTVQVVLRRW